MKFRNIFLIATLLGVGLGLYLAFRPGRVAVRGATVGANPLEKPESFESLMSAGRNYYDNKDAAKAVVAFQKAVAAQPTHPDARLNLANAWLLQGEAANAAREAGEVLQLNPNSAAAHYVLGCAQLRLSKFEEALKELQMAHDIDPSVAAASFQLGRAHMELGHFAEAVDAFGEAIQLQPDHAAAHYALSQVLVRAGRQTEAEAELKRHQEILARTPPTQPDAATYERCRHTVARVPFKLEQPGIDGIKVSFTDVTTEVFGTGVEKYHGPVGVIDFNHDGRNSLFVGEGDGFRLLENKSGRFEPRGAKLPGITGAKYERCLVGDLQNDRFEDVIVLGSEASHVFKFLTNGAVSDVTASAGLQSLKAIDGVLGDLDFTGKLDLFTASTNGSMQIFRNLGNFFFREITATSGIPASLTGIGAMAIEDMNNDDRMDLLIGGESRSPLVLEKSKGAGLWMTNSPGNWPKGSVMAAGDLNNDLRADLLVVSEGQIQIVFGGLTAGGTIPVGTGKIKKLALVDYDNDGWLDVVAIGDGIQVWRNLGSAGFRETTDDLGLKKFAGTHMEGIEFADFDNDGDTDWLLSLEKGGLLYLRNDGGNGNQQFKLRPFGNRSNSSGLGVKVEIGAGGLRLVRTVSQLPVEIGVGKHTQLDALTLHWFDLQTPSTDVKVEKAPFVFAEWILPTGSCPYLYAWDGKRFRFVTDILGAAPVGLRVSDDRFIDADTEEFIRLGDESAFPATDGKYRLQVTEELREVLYLDEAKLVSVDHPAGTVVHTTGKLRAGKPFPSPEIVALENPKTLLRASASGGGAEEDVSDLLRTVDDRFVSPVKLRVPQLRGLAEPYSITMDFGKLETGKPLVLALTGWLRFGGGMANVAASHNPDLPFPFPTLEVETGAGKWQPVKVDVGAPAGKTKTILVDLEGKLPLDATRLKLSMAFEIHWDAAVLFEKSAVPVQIKMLAAARADLHWRGFSRMSAVDWTHPLSPEYEQVSSAPPWRITPFGWCTRYGDTRELISSRDNALVLLNGGDELTLEFAANELPTKAPGTARDFFFYGSGWDKDADFHVERGWAVEPLPWHGMDDQMYAREKRPAMSNDDWMKKYNTRWVGPMTFDRVK